MNLNNNRNWYPLSFIPAFEGHIDQLLDTLEKQRNLFLSSIPGTLDNELNAEVQRYFKKNSEIIMLYQEQIDKWKQETISDYQRKQLEDLHQKLSRARKFNAETVDLVKNADKVTINKILAKDKKELVVDTLSDKLSKE